MNWIEPPPLASWMLEHLTPTDCDEAPTAARFLAFTVAAGLVNAMIASFLLCRVPEAHQPSLTALCVRALLYVLTGALAGVGGSWFYWSNPSSPFRERPPLPFPLFALVCGAGWVWVPCMVLFSQQVSAATAFVAMVSALVISSGLRSATRALFAPASHAPSLWEYNNAELFAESLYRPPFEARGYGIAVSLYAAGWALATHSNYTAALLLALSTFLFVWEKAGFQNRPWESRGEYRRSALRLALVTLPAVLLTMWALLDGVAHRNHTLIARAAGLRTGTGGAKQEDRGHRGIGISGYESIILWPVPQEKKIVAPLPPQSSLLAKREKRPLIIHFDGAYWYFQPPEERPGPEAHQAQATPLDVNIHANDSFPLVMEAHQSLSSSIRSAQCREIDVTIVNREHQLSAMLLAVVLADSAAPGRPTLYLGQQPVVTSEPTQFPSGLIAAHETLRFFLPSSAKIQRFDEITVLFLPELGSLQAGPKIAIEDFQIVPR